jgi:aspartyl/asparaginyl-tRNA synthetase
VEQYGSKVENGFSKKQELELVKHYGSPVFVQRFPAKQKPFYMRINDRNQVLFIRSVLEVFICL